MGLLTKEEYEKYINRLALDNETHIPKWSEPIYICPKCGGSMRKNLRTCRSLTRDPAITEYEYRCDNGECNNIEWQRG